MNLWRDSCNFAQQTSHLLQKSISSQRLQQVAPQLIFSGFKTSEEKKKSREENTVEWFETTL
jgi:hypothetical protein